MASALTFETISITESSDARDAKQAHELGAQVAKDGFQREHDGSIKGNNAVDFGSLVLGACSFSEVTAKATMRGEDIVGLGNYALTLDGQSDQDSTSGGSVTLHFQSAQQLQSELPGIHC
jgi:hypothetical protein